jgi:hypothetical protein
MKQQNFSQGYFHPQHPEKYVGDINKIVYRSSWELKFNQFMDSNPNILKWGSESFAIPYIKPTDQRVHKYYPDYYVVYRDKHGVTHTEVIEVKPASQVSLKKRANLYEQLTYAINDAKWRAAKEFCDLHGITFRIVTEKELFK